MIQVNLLRPRPRAELSTGFFLTLWDAFGQMRGFVQVWCGRHYVGVGPHRRKVGPWEKADAFGVA